MLVLLLMTAIVLASLVVPSIIALALVLMLVRPLVDEMGDDRGTKALVTGLRVATSLGGIATPFSSFASAYAYEYAISKAWLQCTLVSVQIALVALLSTWLYMCVAHRLFPLLIPIRPPLAMLAHKRQESKPLSRLAALFVLLLLALALQLGVWFPRLFGSVGISALAVFMFCFAFEVLDRQDLPLLPWAHIFQVQAALCLACLVRTSGLSSAIAGVLLGTCQRWSGWAVAALLCGAVAAASCTQAHVVVAILAMPIARSVGGRHGDVLCYLAMLTCSVGMLLPRTEGIDHDGREGWWTVGALGSGFSLSIIVTLGYFHAHYILS